MDEVTKRYAQDAAFREVADLLYGGGGNDLIHKMNPAGPDLSTGNPKAKKAAYRAAMAGNTVATVGGLHALGVTLKHAKSAKGKAGAAAVAGWTGLHGVELMSDVAGRKAMKAQYTQKLSKNAAKDMVEQAGAGGAKGKLTQASITTAARAAGKGAAYTKKGGFKRLTDKVVTHQVEKGFRVPRAGSLRAIKRDVAATAGNARVASAHTVAATSAAADAAAHTAHAARETAKTAKTVRRGVQGAAVAGVAGAGAGGYALGGKLRTKVQKNDDIDVMWTGEISKVDADKRQVFGWASIVELNGEPVVDLQGDYISISEVEKSAYDYVHKSRQGGDMHLRDEWNEPKHASHMIESFVVTPEKKKALGLPDDTPVGWWVGYQVNDDDVWNKVKNGERTGFSIHGRGIREDA